MINISAVEKGTNMSLCDRNILDPSPGSGGVRAEDVLSKKGLQREPEECLCEKRECVGEREKSCVSCASKEVLRQLEQSYEALFELSKMRQQFKLSNKRVTSIAREMRELIKVMTTCIF